MKRIIFTLLYDEGFFVLSRNYRRQKIGNLKWLLDQYKLSEIAYGLDELHIINISESEETQTDFLKSVETISSHCFIPICVGGKIQSMRIAQEYFRYGADKIHLNTALTSKPELCRSIATQFGEQAVCAGINFSVSDAVYLHDSDGKRNSANFYDHCNYVLDLGVGELSLHSVDNDGTANGLDMRVLDALPHHTETPVILSGGIGNKKHIAQSLKVDRVDAVATANILNFIGSSFLEARDYCIAEGIALPQFDNAILL